MDKDLIKSLHYLLHMNIHIFDYNNNVTTKYIFYSSPAFNYNYKRMLAYLPPHKYFTFVEGSYKELFLIYKAETCIIIFGPFLCNKVTIQDELKSLSIKEQVLLNDEIEKWINATPLFSAYSLSYLVRLVHFCSTNENTNLMFDSLQDDITQLINDKFYNCKYDLDRKKELFIQTYEFEKKVINALKQDGLEGIYSFETELSSSYLALPHCDISNQKAYLITFIDKLCTTAMEEGVSLLSAFILKEEMIKEVHTLTNTFQVATELHKNILLFKKAIEEAKKTPFINIPLVSQVVSYFDRGNYNNLSIKDLAKELNMSQSSLNKTFKQLTNETISQYILKYRIEKAKKLIKLNYSLQKVSDALGFKSYSHFSSAFKSVVSTSPKQYQLSLKKIIK
ncbi:MAG: helix-turn-helix domain-containing protein [Streptococcus sp.]|nr:helix-turn-helix domain-containing protein [Streptococcus sp.]